MVRAGTVDRSTKTATALGANVMVKRTALNGPLLHIVRPLRTERTTVPQR